jgi:hypothetical protein
MSLLTIVARLQAEHRKHLDGIGRPAEGKDTAPVAEAPLTPKTAEAR